MSKEYERQPEHRPPLEVVAEMAKEAALAHNGHAPTVIAACSGDRWAAGRLRELGSTHAERMYQMFNAGAVLAEQVRTGNLEQVFFITEAWLSMRGPDGTFNVPPSQDPNRKEVLIISQLALNSPEPQLELIVFEMIRDSEERLTDLTPLEDMQEEKQAQADSPLLTALVQGFRVGRGAAMN